MRGVAVVAAGTVAELVARRLVHNAARRVASVTRLPVRRAKADVAQKREEADADAQLLSDTLFVRRVRIRR
jgi:threonine dehydrogenase-like Zn-dependent dehydrogenase